MRAGGRFALGLAFVAAHSGAAAGPCGALGSYALCAEAGEACNVVATGADGAVTRHPVDLPHPEACALIGGSGLTVVEICPDLPAPLQATLIASPVSLAELGETLGGGFTHRQVQALVLVDSAGVLRIGKVSEGAAAREARVFAPDPKHIQIAAHAQGFCAPK
jgi:hypothetical protein